MSGLVREFGLSLRSVLVWMIVVVGIGLLLNGAFHVDETVAAAVGLGTFYVLRFVRIDAPAEAGRRGSDF